MAIANYTDLQTAVANWTSRADLTALIPDFITLAEAKFNRLLRTRDQETEATLTPTNGVLTIPTDFLEMRRIYINTDTPRSLEYLPPEQFYVKYPVLTQWSIGPSQFFTIQSGSIYLSDVTSTNTVKILYYAKIPALASNSTNWLLTAHPDIYLAAAMAEASDKIKDVDGVNKWNAKMQGLIESLNNSDWHGKYSGSALRVIAA